MNAGELVVSLLLKAGDFKAQVQAAQERLDGVQAAAVDAGRATYDAGVKGAAGLGQSADAASSVQAAFDEAVQKGREISASARAAGRDISDATKRGGRGLDDLGSSAREAGKELEKAGTRGADSFSEFVGILKKGAAILGGIALIKSTVAGVIERGAELAAISESLGRRTEDFQPWADAFGEMGVELREVEQLFHDVSDRATDLVRNNAGPFKELQEQYGLLLTDGKGKMLPVEEQLMHVSKIIDNMDRDEAAGVLERLGITDPATQRALLQGSEKLDALVKKYREMGSVTSKNAEKFRALQKQMEALKIRAFSALTPVVGRLGDGFLWLLDKAQDFVSWAKDNTSSVVIFFTAIATVVTVAVTPALTAMATAAWAAIAPFTPFIAAVAAIALVIEDLAIYIQGGESAFGDFWKMFGEGDELGARFKSLWEGIKSILASVGAALKAVAKFFILIFSLTGQGVVKAVEGIWKGVTKLYDVLRSMLDWVAKKLYNLLPDWIKKWLGGDESSRPEEEKTEAKLGGVADSMRVGDARPSILPPQVRAGDARPESVSNVNNSSRQTVFNNDIEIVTQATDGQGLAQELDRTWRNQTAQADSAFGY